MPAQRYEAGELDQDTIDYLHRAVESEGRGMPGLYYDAEDGKVGGTQWPVWGFVAGPIILIVTFFLTWDSMRSPVPVALLMTAGYLLGGWLLVAATRCMIARGRERYLGYFEYVDPLYLWRGRGSAVEVEPLHLLTGAERTHSVVSIEKSDGDVTLDLRTPGLAAEVADYLSAVPEVQDDDPVKRGYEAKARVLDEDEGREVGAIPAPRRQRPSRGWVMPLVLIASTAALFFCCDALAVTMRDGAIFELVDKKDPGWLRLYLIDPRNTRHRAEVVKQLQGFHNGVAARIEAGKGDAELQSGLADVIRALADHGQPLVTVGFVSSEKGPGVPEGYFSAATKAGLEKHIVLELHKVIEPLVKVPPTPNPSDPTPPRPLDLVDVAQVLDGPAMMLIEAKVTPPDKADRECVIAWKVTFQATAEGDKRVAKFETKARAGDDIPKAVRELYGNFTNAFRGRIGG